MPLRNGVEVATKNPKKKPVWEMSVDEQKDDKTLVFDYDELLEFAEGNIGPVFGPKFSIIDNYSRRVRLPAREYLLVSRVTKMNAEPNKFVAGATMTTEYDLPVNGELSMGGDVPWAILVESGQCDLMLISYMGIDFQCKGDRVYRLLDTTLTFFGVAKEGETLVYDIKVNGFAKGKNGQISMFFFEYDCYCNGHLLIEMRNGAAGFFSDEELALGKGVVRTKAELDKRKELKANAHKNKAKVQKLMVNPCKKTSFSPTDMQKLVAARWDQVMGPDYAINYRLAAPKMLMIDNIPHIDPFGGVYGLGLVIGEKFLDPEHWYFPCHFVKDQVMAGSLVSDGCSQLAKVLMMWHGWNKMFEGEFKFRPVSGQQNKVRCRGQISPHKGKLMYIMEVREIGFGEDGLPYALADVDIIDVDYSKNQKFEWSTKEELEAKLDEYGKGDLSRKIVVDFKGIALKMEGKLKKESPKSSLKVPNGCLKSDPSPPTEVTWHPYYELLKKLQDSPRRPSFFPSAYPPREICFAPFLKNRKSAGHFLKRIENGEKLSSKDVFNEIDLDFVPGKFPLNFYNMCEFMCGLVSNCIGPEGSIFDVSRTSRSPAFDLQLVTRVIRWTDLVQKNVMGVDVDPSVGEMIAEFDVPEDAWFFDAFASNKTDENYSHVPYSILMEVALQTSGILTSILKAPLTMKQKDILFRNLDATSELSQAIKNIDLRGKTIINRSKCKGYTMLGKMGIHKFSFELYIKDKDDGHLQGNVEEYINDYDKINIDNNKLGCIYKGDTSFGWFVPEVFENQVGLDSGKKTQPKFLTSDGYSLKKTIKTFRNMNTASGKMQFVGENEVKQSLLRQTTQSEFLDEVNIGENYVHGKKDVDTTDWFFSCHFWNDPVMPGSLGIESMVQLIEYYAIQNELFKELSSSDDGAFYFRHCEGKTSWKYRGQLTPKNKRMDSEVFIQKVKKTSPTTLLIEVNGNLFVDNLRVYEVKNLRLELVYEKAKKKMNGFKKPQSLVEAEDASLLSLEELREKLLNTEETLKFRTEDSHVYKVKRRSLLDLGDKAFAEFYGVKANLYSGAMAKGIASADLVIAMGKHGFLGSLGAGGLPMHVVEKALTQIKEELGEKPFAVNLIHSPFNPTLEEGNVELFKKFGVKVVEASAFMKLTPSVILYRARGLSLEKDGKTIVISNKLIAKCSRTEVAAMFLKPAPIKMLDDLLKEGKITREQHKLAQILPVADDISVEADSGGHTDNRQIQVILPLVIRLRDKIFAELKSSLKGNYKIKAASWDVEKDCSKEIAIEWPLRPRVGGGGGIGCPEAAVCAFSLGAAFLVTGTINQMCKESGTCDQVRRYLSEASYADVTMAPAADMFDQGVELQVLKKGTMFPSRAKKLYDLFCKYDSFEDFPEREMSNLEKRIFKKTVAEVWQETKDFYTHRLKDTKKIDKVEVHGDQKLKMSLCFRWYLGLSSFWANSGDVSRKTDYQIWCGPAIGAFNEFIRDSFLDPKVSGKFPSVVDANTQVLKGAAYLQRVNDVKLFRDSLKVKEEVFASDIGIYFPK